MGSLWNDYLIKSGYIKTNYHLPPRKRKRKAVKLTINPNSHKNQYIRLGKGSRIEHSNIPSGITLYCAGSNITISNCNFMGSSNIERPAHVKNVVITGNWFQGTNGIINLKQITWFAYIRRKMREK